MSVDWKRRDSPVLPLHNLAIGIADGMAIAELTLGNKATPAALAMAFRPGAFAILWQCNAYA
jgi:hypothetical protein